VACSLTVLYLEGGGDVGEGRGPVGLHVLLQALAELEESLGVVDLDFDALLESLSEGLQVVEDALGEGEGVVGVELPATRSTLKVPSREP
jgi:hypothetical protein